MNLTEKFIDACHRARACDEGLAWLRKEPRTLEQLYKHNAGWFFWLENILSESAWKAYIAARKSTEEAYTAAMESTGRAYTAAMESTGRAYTAVRKSKDAALKSTLIKALKMDGWK